MNILPNNVIEIKLDNTIVPHIRVNIDTILALSPSSPPKTNWFITVKSDPQEPSLNYFIPKKEGYLIYQYLHTVNNHHIAILSTRTYQFSVLSKAQREYLNTISSAALDLFICNTINTPLNGKITL